MKARKGESLPTVNTLTTLLAKLDAMTNTHHYIITNRDGYAIGKDSNTIVLSPSDTVSALYDRVEEYYYSVMYSCFSY
jgi:hypothetical protein